MCIKNRPLFKIAIFVWMLADLSGLLKFFSSRMGFILRGVFFEERKFEIL